MPNGHGLSSDFLKRAKAPVAVRVDRIVNSEPGQNNESVIVRGLNDKGIHFEIEVPLELIGVLVTTFARAEQQTIALKGSQPGVPQVVIQRPVDFVVRPSPEVDGVAIMFDPNSRHVQAFGLAVGGAMAMANALGEAAHAQHTRKPRLIVPR